MARKSKKVFKVDKEVNSGAEDAKGASWIRQKGQFETEEDAQAYIDELNAGMGLDALASTKFKIGKEDRV
tara:strand:- start:390 stop:599 length:210 start_codon:yes stop_codon:yes gene_type:complete